MTDKPALIELLIQYGARLDQRNNYGLNALMIAVDKRHYKVAERLLENGADINQIAKDGRTVTDIAKHLKDKDMLDILKRHDKK